MKVSLKNPWAVFEPGKTPLEPQRVDLWLLDIVPIVNAVTSVPGVIPGPRFRTLASEAAKVLQYRNSLPVRLIVPEIGLDTIRGDTHSKPELFPGYDVIPSTARLELLWNVTDPPMPSPVPAQALISAWAMLARAGQLIDSNEMPLESPESVVRFAVDLDLRFYGGSEELDGLSRGLGLRLKDAWVSGVQVSEIDRSESPKPVYCVATLQVADVQTI